MRNIFYSILLLITVLAVIVPAQRPRHRELAPLPKPTPTPIPTPNQLPQTVSNESDLTQQIEALTKQISNGMRDNRKRTIAVVELVDLNGNVTNFGRFLAEELITRLHQSNFKVIERQLLNKVTAEQKLSLTGAVDQSSAQKLGKILGVDAITTGTVTDLGKVLRINARLINTETGEIFAVASTQITKDESVLGLMNGGGSVKPAGISQINTPAQSLGANDDRDKILKDLVALEQQINAASMRGDADFVEKTLADEFILTYEGTTLTKWQYLSRLTRSSDYVSSSIHNPILRLDGNTAILSGTGITSNRGYRLITEFSLTFIKRDGRWQVISAKILHEERVGN